MDKKQSFSSSLDVAREFFSGTLTTKRAHEIIEQLKKSGSLSSGILRSYLADAYKLPQEMQKLLVELLYHICQRKQDIMPLLPALLPIISSSSTILRNAVINIVCSMNDESLISEHFCYGFLRHPDEEVKIAGAQLLLHIAQFKNQRFIQSLQPLRKQFDPESEVFTLLTEAIEVCQNNEVSSAQSSKPSSASFDIDLEGKSILLVDDDEQILNLLENILLKFKAEVAQAHNGQEAFDILKAVYESGGGYDLLITDLRMPLVNGMSLIQNFREAFPDVDIPIIILTAVKDKQIALTAMNKYKIKHYLIKPVPIMKLCHSLESAFSMNK